MTHHPVQQSLLDPTGDVAHERQVIADEPRPGSWFGDDDADGRLLTQEETDQLIRCELHVAALGSAPPETIPELTSIVGEPRHVELAFEGRGVYRASKQRGGTDSDPLVRLLAFRAWGDRDRRWFLDRGVKKGDPIAVIGASERGDRLLTEVALSRPHEFVIGVAQGDAHPGAGVQVEVDPDAVRGMSIVTVTGEPPRGNGLWTLRVGGRLRTRPGTVATPQAPRDDGADACKLPPSASYRFDKVAFERDPVHGYKMITGVRGGVRARVRIDGYPGSADGWHRCLGALAREFEDLEAAAAERGSRSR
jgi:hypothetical protein